MFNESLLILLPKLPAGQVGTPAETRPINITNGENLILANAIRYKAEAELGKWVTEMQQGFLPGRSLLRNVVEVSQSMQEVSLNQQSGLAIFYDFQAAFPSVCHEFLLAVLEAGGVPTGFMQFVRHLYHNNRCSLVLGGERVESFARSSGIRQGCPLSPLIFAVSIDLLLRRARRLCPEVLIRAYADDIAMVVPRGWEQLPMLHKIMEDFALCSGLALNLPKNVGAPACARRPVRSSRPVVLRLAPLRSGAPPPPRPGPAPTGRPRSASRHPFAPPPARAPAAARRPAPRTPGSTPPTAATPPPHSSRSPRPPPAPRPAAGTPAAMTPARTPGPAPGHPLSPIHLCRCRSPYP